MSDLFRILAADLAIVTIFLDALRAPIFKGTLVKKTRNSKRKYWGLKLEAKLRVFRKPEARVNSSFDPTLLSRRSSVEPVCPVEPANFIAKIH